MYRKQYSICVQQQKFVVSNNNLRSFYFYFDILFKNNETLWQVIPTKHRRFPVVPNFTAVLENSTVTKCNREGEEGEISHFRPYCVRKISDRKLMLNGASSRTSSSSSYGGGGGGDNIG